MLYYNSKSAKFPCGKCRYDRLEKRNITGTCSRESDQRGPNQKVISYSLYGQLQKFAYFPGILQNLKLIREWYPGYVMRLYYGMITSELREAMDKLCELYCDYPELDLCAANRIGRNKDFLQHLQYW